MVEFAYYKFAFHQREEKAQRSLLTGEQLNEEQLTARMREELERLLLTPAKSLNLFDLPDDKDSGEIFENTVVQSLDGVTLLEVRDNKSKDYVPKESHQPLQVAHYPICRVLLDCRPGHEAMLVEMKQEAFRRNPDKVVRLIQFWIVRTFSIDALGYQVSFDQRHCLGDIWQTVRNRTCDGRDILKRLVLKFDGRARGAKSNEASAIATILESFASVKGEMKLYASEETQQRFLEKNKDLVNIVNMMISYDYHIQAYFKNTGMYEYGRHAKAVYGVEDGHITNFGQASFGPDGQTTYALIEWLDSILHDDQASYTPVVATKRKKSNRRHAEKTD